MLLRDADYWPLTLFPSCIVIAKIFDQKKDTPFKDLLWSDEIKAQKIIYPFRAYIRFNDVPLMNLLKLSWDSLGRLQFRNVKGKIIKGAQGWGKKFMGNFIESKDELEKFTKLIELQ